MFGNVKFPKLFIREDYSNNMNEIVIENEYDVARLLEVELVDIPEKMDANSYFSPVLEARLKEDMGNLDGLRKFLQDHPEWGFEIYYKFERKGGIKEHTQRFSFSNILDVFTQGVQRVELDPINLNLSGKYEAYARLRKSPHELVYNWNGEVPCCEINVK